MRKDQYDEQIINKPLDKTHRLCYYHSNLYVL